MSYPYPYTEGLTKRIRGATNYQELLSVAHSVLAIIVDDHPRKLIAIVCGPISTGGKGSRKENLEIFSRAIDRAVRDDLLVFNQMPFEDDLERIYKSNPEMQGARLLEEFYLPLFEDGWIKLLCFLPRWESSVGARWEHSQAERLGIPRIYLSDNYTRE